MHLGNGWAALARTNPMVPMVARTNPAWDQSRFAIWEHMSLTSTLKEKLKSLFPGLRPL